ncbi:MAG: hypothetical protein FK730_01460 [Asgard group archaeon]|nr:hypothetical protein [Asgard group archaeon]
MDKSEKLTLIPATAVYLAGLTRNGPEILSMEPKLTIPANDMKELAYKSIPMSGKDGDFLSVSIPKFQATCLVNQVPAFKDSPDTRDTFLSFGLILQEDTNPIPYRNLLRRITSICKTHNLLSFDCLKKISSKLIKTMTVTHECTFSLEIKKGTKIEFSFMDDFDEWIEKNGQGNKMTSNDFLYQGVLTLDEAMEREKSAFILDKTILKVICSEGPVSIDVLRRKTLPLEGVLNIKIDKSMIEEVLQRYLKDGIIKTVSKE